MTFGYSIIDLARKLFFNLPEPLKLVIVKMINNFLLYFHSRR